MQDETRAQRLASIVATNGTSAASIVTRTIYGVECACCGTDIRRGARRIMNATGNYCSYDCAREPS